MARRGREPALKLERDGRRVSMRSWGAELLDSMQGICELLDAAHPQRPYVAALREQTLKLEEVEHTPSARLLRELRAQPSRASRRWRCASRASTRNIVCRRAACGRTAARIRGRSAAIAAGSIAALEAAPRGSFEDYLASYLAD